MNSRNSGSRNSGARNSGSRNSTSAAPPIVGASAGRPGDLGDAKRRVVELLKRSDSMTASELATRLDVTDAAVRQHLDALEIAGFVESGTAPAEGRGRPPTNWRLTPSARDLFPDRHGDLSVELLRAIREGVGEEGLDAVIAARTRAQISTYASQVDRTAPIRDRVAALAAIRSREGYMAEAVYDQGAQSTSERVVLVEHHCPICDAAEQCQGLCRSELELFRAVLGDDVEVDRSSHLLSGDKRCVYEVGPAQNATQV